MTWTDVLQKVFTKREPEVYTPQREHIDRRHDALQRQLSYYQKKREIPIMEAKLKQYEKQVYGDCLHTRDEHNILKAPNVINDRYRFKLHGRSMLR